MKPVLYTKVVDHNGNILLSNTQKGKRVMKESTAFLLTDAMKDVITKGTGKSAKLSSSMAVAGKIRNYFKQLRLLVQRLFSLSYSFCLDGL